MLSLALSSVSKALTRLCCSLTTLCSRHSTRGFTCRLVQCSDPRGQQHKKVMLTCRVCTETSFWLNSFCSFALDASNSCRLQFMRWQIVKSRLLQRSRGKQGGGLRESAYETLPLAICRMLLDPAMTSRRELSLDGSSSSTSNFSGVPLSASLLHLLDLWQRLPCCWKPTRSPPKPAPRTTSAPSIQPDQS